MRTRTLPLARASQPTAQTASQSPASMPKLTSQAGTPFRGRLAPAAPLPAEGRPSERAGNEIGPKEGWGRPGSSGLPVPGFPSRVSGPPASSRPLGAPGQGGRGEAGQRVRTRGGGACLCLLASLFAERVRESPAIADGRPRAVPRRNSPGLTSGSLLGSLLLLFL